MAVEYVGVAGYNGLKVAGTTIATTNGVNTVAGNLLQLCVVFDNAATASKPTVSSISKPAGETASWVFLGAARSTSTSAGAFSSGEMWAIKTTVAWPNATTPITVTLDTSVTQKAVFVRQFSGVDAVLRSTVGTAYSTTTTAASATTTGTTPAIGDLALGMFFQSNSVLFTSFSDTDTVGGPWLLLAGFDTTGGSSATNNALGTQYKILSAASHQTFNIAATLTAGNGSIVAILQASPPPVLAKVDTLVDPFDTLSTAVWEPWGGGVSAVGGYLRLEPTIGSTTYVGMSSKAHYDMRDTRAYVDIFDVGDQSLASWEATVLIINNPAQTSHVQFHVATGYLYAHATEGTIGFAAWNAINHRYVGIRHSVASGRIYFETSPNGTTWAPFAVEGGAADMAVPGAINPADVIVQFSAGHYFAEAGKNPILYINGINNVAAPSVPGRPKIYTGSAFAQKPAKIWTGSAWVEKPVKIYTGSVWKTVT